MNSEQREFYLKVGESLSDAMKEKIREANASRTKSGDFIKYKCKIREIFCIKEKTLTKNDLIFLGGFIEGEGSLSVSIKTTQARISKNFNILLDPEFTITQQANGASVLYRALEHFGTGTFSYKTGSKSTLVYKIDNRQSLSKVITFYKKYVNPYGSLAKVKRFEKFKSLLEAFGRNEHQDANLLVENLLPLWDSLRVQAGNVNEKFSSLKEAQDFVQAEAKRMEEIK